jgi:hypothetical protein
MRTRRRSESALVRYSRINEGCREGLLNASAFFYVSSLPRLADLVVHANRLRQAMSARRFRRTDVAAALRLAQGWPVLAGAGLSRLRRRPYLVDSLVVVEQIEQVPERERYVALGDGRDRFGRPSSRFTGTSMLRRNGPSDDSMGCSPSASASCAAGPSRARFWPTRTWNQSTAMLHTRWDRRACRTTRVREWSIATGVSMASRISNLGRRFVSLSNGRPREPHAHARGAGHTPR